MSKSIDNIILTAAIAWSSSICMAQSANTSHQDARTRGPQSPAIAGSNNTVIYENKTYVRKVTPSASVETKRALQGQAKIYLGSNTGWDGLLIPAHDPSPKSACSPDADGFTVFLGRGPGAFTCSSKNACILLSDAYKESSEAGLSGSASLLSIDKSGPNYILNGKVLGPTGRLVVLFRNNEIFTDKQQVSIVERPNPSTLRVLDLQGNAVLYLEYVNSRSMLLRGSFYSEEGNDVQISDGTIYVSKARAFTRNSCFSNVSIGISF